MVIYNIQTNGPSSQLVIELMNDSVFVEPQEVAYIVGDLKLDASGNGWHNHLLAYFIGSKYFKPGFKGTGKIYLKPTLGSYYKFNLHDDEQLIIDNKSFIACRDTIKVKPHIRFSLSKFISGTQIINTLVQGSGNLVIHMPGPVTEIKLNNERFVAYATDVAAYSPGLHVSREPAGRGWLKIAHMMVNVYRGNGVLYFSPHPNKGTKVKSK